MCPATVPPTTNFRPLFVYLPPGGSADTQLFGAIDSNCYFFLHIREFIYLAAPLNQ